MTAKQQFITSAEAYIADGSGYKKAVKSNQSLENKVNFAKTWFDKYDLAKQRAAYLKTKALENADKLLSGFEFDLNNTKIKVVWATDATNAMEEIANIVKNAGTSSFAAQDSNIIKELKFSEKYQNNLVDATSHKAKFISVCEADFLIAETSTIVCISSDKKSSVAQAKASAQLFICGIDKVIQNLNEIDLFLSLQTINKQGAPVSTQVNFYNGNKFNEDDSLTDDIYVIILDNGRTDILADADQRQVLNCIQCDACSRVCPVYLHVGKNAYNTVYTGPQGALVSPAINNNAELKHLAFASNLCGKCTEVCPMNIDIKIFLEYSRRDAVSSNTVSKIENVALYFWKNAVLKRGNMDKGGAKLKSFMLKQMYRKNWGDKREMPVPAAQSFNQLWRERKDFC